MSYRFTVPEITSWYRSKQGALKGSSVSLESVRESSAHANMPSACADFDGVDAMGRINAWVSGSVDFEVIRVSDGKDLLWRHVDASTLADLETTYLEFLRYLESTD